MGAAQLPRSGRRGGGGRTGKWKSGLASIGAGTDSFYEYLQKSSTLFGDEEMGGMFREAYAAVETHLVWRGWHVEVDMLKGQVCIIFKLCGIFFFCYRVCVCRSYRVCVELWWWWGEGCMVAIALAAHLLYEAYFFFVFLVLCCFFTVLVLASSVLVGLEKKIVFVFLVERTLFTDRLSYDSIC